MAVEQLTEQGLQDKLAIALQTWPLYRRLEYSGAVNTITVPKYLTLFCPHCRLETFWQTSLYQGESNINGHAEKTYKCRNCNRGEVRYYFCWYFDKTKALGIFYKVGQDAPLEERVPEALENALGSDDLKTYKNSLRLRNFGLGVGAVAYLRRVVENKMNDMLDILHKAAREHKAPEAVLNRLEEIKKDRRFAVKVDYAGDLVPEHLRPAGNPNPIAVFHELASEGLHSKSDEECVDIFDACRKSFEFFFGKLRVEIEEAKQFVGEFAGLVAKRSPKEGQSK